MLDATICHWIVTLNRNLINKGQCVCVCVLSVEIQTTGRILMKIGTEVVLKGEGSWGGGEMTWYPWPHCYRVCNGGPGCLWSLSCAFWCKLYKSKVARSPWFKGGSHLLKPKIHIQKDLGPTSFWSHGHSCGVCTTKVVGTIPKFIWSCCKPPTLTHGVQGSPKGGLVGFWSLSHAFWRTLYNTKVAGRPQLSGDR